MDVRPGFPFRVFLPIAQLLVSILLLWPYWPRLRVEVWQDIQSIAPSLLGTPDTTSSAVLLNVTPTSVPSSEVNWAEVRLGVPAAINIPVGLVELPLVAASSSNTEWTPEGIWVREWRALSWPVVGIFFWWIAGRAFEALFSARLHLIRPPLYEWEVLLGVLLLICGSIAAVLLLSESNFLGLAKDNVLAAGAALWAILGATIVLARILQWGLRRMARREGIALVP